MINATAGPLDPRKLSFAFQGLGQVLDALMGAGQATFDLRQAGN